MACLFITVGPRRTVGEFAFPADAALHTWVCFLKLHHVLQFVPHQMLLFIYLFFYASVGVDMGSPELRQLIDLVHQIQTSLLTLLSSFRSFMAFLSSELHFPLVEACPIASDPSCFAV